MFCTANDEEADLVVDYLDMSSNDPNDGQIPYLQVFEMYQNTPITTEMNLKVNCPDAFFQRRVLPRHGTMQLSGRQIVYSPNPDFTGKDSIQYEVCCKDYCNVYKAKFVIWKDTESRCEESLINQPSHFYHDYSIGEINSSTINIGLFPVGNCGQFVEAIIITKNPKFGSVTVIDQQISFQGYLPKNTSDTVLYTMKIRGLEKATEKSGTFVIERFD